MQAVVFNCRFLCSPFSGVQRYALGLAVELFNSDVPVRFVAPPSARNSIHAKLLPLEYTGTTEGHFWEQISLPLYLKAQGNPLLISPANTGPVCYTHQLCIIHDLAFTAENSGFSFAFRTWYSILIPRIIRNIQYPACISRFTEGEIRRKCSYKGDLLLLPAFVYPPAPSVRAEPEARRVLWIGSLQARKDPSTVIEAFKDVRLSEYHLDIIGSSAAIYKYKLPELPSNVRILSNVTDAEKWELTRRSRCVISSSRYEGFGMPGLEALSLGVPVILSDIPAHREVFGTNATFFEPGNKAELVECILSTGETQNPLQLYTVEDTARKLIQFIFSIAEK